LQGAVYALCVVSALVCALLLLRGYRRRGVRLLLWCGVFFVAQTLENAILFTDVMLGPDIDLSSGRLVVGLTGMALLFYGLIWEVK
jgi:hypothetical protein